ncbi:hypothetical protein ACN47E_003718 [Coniothyrium glycines]
MSNLQANIYACMVVTWFAAISTLALRIHARRLTQVGWWFDDYFVVLAFLFATGYCAIMIPWTQHYYLGKFMPSTLDEATVDHILYMNRKLSFFNSLCYASSLACSKISILSFYWRLFKTSIIRIPILFLLGVSMTWWIIRTAMLTFRCVPTEYIWNKNIEGAVCNINADQFFLATITTHFLLDVIILVLPIAPVFRLCLRFQQKLGIVIFFLLGTIVCVASCIVLVILVRWPANSTQIPYDYATFCIWGVVEVNIAIVSGCVPLLRPVIRRVFPNIFSAFSSHPQSRPSRAVKLSSFSRRDKSVHADDSSSTHQLSDEENLKSMDDNPHKGSQSVQTVISSDAHWTALHSHDRLDLAGIRVLNETVVEVKNI